MKSIDPVRIGTLILLSTVALASPLQGQEFPIIKFQGQIRPRTENVSPGDGSWDSFTSMRVRAAITAQLEGGTKVYIEFQDVRLFGEEFDTKWDYQADNLDLHQGYLEIWDAPGIPGMLRAGRQEMALGEQRLVGPVNWGQQGRSFDGVRYSAFSGDFTLDLFAMKLTEATAPEVEYDSEFFGAWANMAEGVGGTLDLFGLVTRDARDEGSDEQTVGANWRWERGPVKLRVEGSVQRGTRGDDEVSAWMLALRAGRAFSNGLSVTLWYDHLSGDETPGDGEAGVFNTLYATNHALYGRADYFTNIPVHTGGLGLKDAALKLAFAPGDVMSIDLDLHNFQTAQEGTLSTRTLGNEVDLTASRDLSPGLSLMTGYSFFQARDGIKELGRASENGHWMYLMLTAIF